MQNIRERTEEIELQTLNKYASQSKNSKGRAAKEEQCQLRTDFQRDRDRIIHCKAFRRLKHKTQVFLSPEGDHYRTRLTHVLEVSQISRTIARCLRLNEDLTEAIALGHDLGHTPFGHAGERAISSLCVETKHFYHYEQSVRVITKLENNFKGLNLTDEVIDGIANHTTGVQPYTLEGQVVRLSDRIAYMNHDIDDAVRAGVMRESDLPEEIIQYFGKTKSQRINSMVLSIVNSSYDKDIISMNVADRHQFDILHKFLFDTVYNNKAKKHEEEKIYEFIEKIFNYYMTNYNKLPCEYSTLIEREGVERAVVDYIAGMTDHFAINIYKNLFIPASWGV